VNPLRGMVPPSGKGRILALGGTIDSIGSGLFLAASTLYFVQVVGLSAVAVGAALGVARVCGLLSPVPLGRLADQLGAGRVFVALLALRGLGYAGYALVDDYPSYLALTCVLAAADAASVPLFQAVVGDAVPATERTATMASIRAVRNVGLGIGFLLAAGAQALYWGPAFHILFVLNGMSFLAMGLAIRRVRGHVNAGPRREAAASTASRLPHRDGRFVGLVAANALAMLHDSILFVLLPLWVVGVLGLPASFSSILLALSTAQTALTQGYLARFANGLAPSVRTIRLACGLLVLTCALFAAASGLGGTPAAVGAVTGVVVLTLAETLLVAASWELSYTIAPEDRRAQYLAFFSLGFGSQRAVGPLLMTAVVLPAGYAGWALLSVLFVVAAGGTTLAVRPVSTT
jgi:Na+/melibiose symporter-like transporter